MTKRIEGKNKTSVSDRGFGSSGLPLYRGAARPNALPPGAHAGLWYDKFCNTSPALTGKKPGRRAKRDNSQDTWKSRWIKQFNNKPVGDREQLQESSRRREQLIKAQGGRCIQLDTRARFITGMGRAHPMENGFAWHPTLGVPFLPGSSLKGLVRAWATSWADAPDELLQIFGTPARAGSVVFLDALPTTPTRLQADIMTPHVSPWYQASPGELTPAKAPADWHAPTPIPFLTVAAGQTFQFALLPATTLSSSRAADKVLEQTLSWLKLALNWLGAGAKTSAGYGRFS